MIQALKTSAAWGGTAGVAQRGVVVSRSALAFAAAVVAVFALPTTASAQTTQVLNPPDGATLPLDRSTTFEWNVACPPGSVTGIGFSPSPEVRADGVFVHPTEIDGRTPALYGTPPSQNNGDLHTYTYDAPKYAYLEVPTPGSTIYWAAGCAITSAGGLTGTDVAPPRSLLVGPRTQPPDPGDIGFTIKGGAKYTNDPRVVLDVVAGEFSTEIRVANDGGFAGDQAFPVSDDYRFSVPWTLDSSGPERLPKTAYLRFAYPPSCTPPCAGGVTYSANYTDDIILDETNPELQSVALSGSGSRPAKVAARPATYKLKIKASDKTSGVEEMQITSKKSKPGKWKPYKAKAKFKTSKPKVFVRVRDAAGNESKWKRAR